MLGLSLFQYVVKTSFRQNPKLCSSEHSFIMITHLGHWHTCVIAVFWIQTAVTAVVGQPRTIHDPTTAQIAGPRKMAHNVAEPNVKMLNL